MLELATQSPVQDPSALTAGMGDDCAIVAFAAEHQLPWLTQLDDRVPHPQFLQNIPIGFARRHGIMGFESNSALLLVLADPASYQVLDVLQRQLGKADIAMAPRALVLSAIDRAYQDRSGLAAHAIESVDRGRVLAELDTPRSKADLLDVTSQAPVIQVVNLVLFEAVQARASDVHVQPTEEKLIVRYRIDGVLDEMFAVPKSVQSELISRIKVMGQMNVAETRLPQDGRATVKVGSRTIDLRISTIPTSHGERAVIRLLDKSAHLYKLDQLGMARQTLASFRRLIGAEHGLLLVTGPTGSGKTTTLYAAIGELDAVAHNILTSEDPIEYELDGISQTPVAHRKGMTFASALRNVLRQDPDVIMVGEIRDAETAHMAIQAALTGHLVLSTLHTNDAASAVTRLLDLGIEPFLLSSCLIGVVAQRLVRRLCNECRHSTPIEPADAALFRAGGSTLPPELLIGDGCAACRHSGFRSRLGLFELLSITPAIAQAIAQRGDLAQIRALAGREGAPTLLQDGLAKVSSGLTTCSEVRKVTVTDASINGEGQVSEVVHAGV